MCMPQFLSKVNHRKFLLIVTFNVTIFTILVVAIEFISSLIVSKPFGNIISDVYLNHTWKPNYSTIHKEWIHNNPDFPTPYTHYYNSQGWLELYDVTKEKRPGIYRIFYLGDSFTEGTSPMDKSVPSIVEQRLNDFSKGMNLKFEVINTGTSSYSPILEYLLLRHVVVQYSPDLIIINVDMTDDFDDWKYRQTLILDEDGNPFAAPPRDLFASNYIDTKNGPMKMGRWNKLWLFLVQNSHTFNLLLQQKNKYFNAAKDTPESSLTENQTNNFYQRWSWLKLDWDELTVRNVDYTLDILKRIALFSKERNIKVLFTAAPHYPQYNGQIDGSGTPAWSSRPHYEIAKVAKDIEVPYLNSFEELKPLIQGTVQSAYYYVRDVHFNPRGYKIWANSHVQFLINSDNSLLPREFYQHLSN